MPVSVDLPEGMKEELEKKKEEEYYSSMSEIIREALRQYLKKDEISQKEEAMLELARMGKIEQVELEDEAKESLKRGLEQMEND